MSPRALSAFFALLVPFLTACSGGGGGFPGGSPGNENGGGPPPVHFSGNPPLVPSQGIYLGAFVNDGSGASQEQMLAGLEKQIGRTFALSMHYYGWQSNFPTGAEAVDAQVGRIPVISWNCGVSNASVAAGRQDANIAAHADALKAYGGPVFLRYQWEMNLPVTANSRAQCYDPVTDLPGGSFSPTQFIAAWNHIHAIFVAHGANNVAFLWNPSGGGENALAYYPDPSTVDWAGIDQYDRTNVPFADVYTLYGSIAALHKPILIAETGASPTYQPVFFAGAAVALQTLFPAVKGFMYFDGAGNDDWRLTPAGIAALATVARDPYLAAK